MSIRFVQGKLLARPVARSMSWGALAVMVGVSHAMIAVMTWRRPLDGLAATDLLRRAAFFTAIGTAGLLDDPAAVMVESAPPSLAWRRSLRGLLIAAAVAVGWGSLLLSTAARVDGPVAWWWMTLELVALVTATLAIAVAAVARGRSPMITAGSSIFIAMLAMPLVPARWSFVAGIPGDLAWRDSHLRWAALLGLAALSVVLASRDPARRRLRIEPFRRGYTTEG